jgi:hypothetical protein
MSLCESLREAKDLVDWVPPNLNVINNKYEID